MLKRNITRRALLSTVSVPLIFSGCTTFNPKELKTITLNRDLPLTRIILGSCLRETRPQPIWRTIIESGADLFIHLGDNVYLDTKDETLMRIKYGRLWSDPGYRDLRNKMPVLATWDDHDYGSNNSGFEFVGKERSRRVFCDFFGEPADALRRRRPGGIYDGCIVGPPGRRVQVLLLDIRWDRSPLLKVAPEKKFHRQTMGMGYYRPNTALGARIMGEAQWEWLEQQLKKPAELRLIASGTRVLAEGTGKEEWANFPLERHRIFNLIRKSNANGVLFVSGDPHFSEYMQLDDINLPYSLREMTSSALNQYNTEYRRNIRRVVGPYGEPNFGMIEIDWRGLDTIIRLNTRGLDGRPVMRQDFRLDQLKQRPT